MSDCSNPNLSAYDRAKIDDAERFADAGETVDEADSRDKLEADVGIFYDEHECDTLMNVDFHDAVFAWLDRQAALTRRVYEAGYLEKNRMIRSLTDEMGKLSDRIGELERGNIELADRNRYLDISVDELIESNEVLQGKLDQVRRSLEKAISEMGR